MRHGLIRTNPTTAIAWDECLPKAEARPRAIFSERELLRLVDAAADPEGRAFLGLLAGTGLRVSEGLGLRRCDLGESSVTVAQQAASRRIGPPKTAAGARVVPVLPEFLEHLEAARLMAAGKDPEALVFGDLRGRPRARAEVQRRWLHKAQDAAGLGRSGLHALRLSYALLLAARGATPIDARDLFDHSSVAMTSDVYQREGTRGAARAFAAGSRGG